MSLECSTWSSSTAHLLERYVGVNNYVVRRSFGELVTLSWTGGVQRGSTVDVIPEIVLTNHLLCTCLRPDRWLLPLSVTTRESAASAGCSTPDSLFGALMHFVLSDADREDGTCEYC